MLAGGGSGVSPDPSRGTSVLCSWGAAEFSQPSADACAENLVLPRPREHQPLPGDSQGAARTSKAGH